MIYTYIDINTEPELLLEIIYNGRRYRNPKMRHAIQAGITAYYYTYASPDYDPATQVVASHTYVINGDTIVDTYTYAPIEQGE